MYYCDHEKKFAKIVFNLQINPFQEQDCGYRKIVTILDIKYNKILSMYNRINFGNTFIYLNLYTSPQKYCKASDFKTNFSSIMSTEPIILFSLTVKSNILEYSVHMLIVLVFNSKTRMFNLAQYIYHILTTQISKQISAQEMDSGDDVCMTDQEQ